MAGYRPGTTWGSIYDAAKSPWTPMGSTGQFADMTAIIEPDNPFDNSLKGMQANLLRTQDLQAQQNMGLQKKKFDMFKSLLGNFPGMNGSGSMSRRPMSNIPAPNYVSAGPVWSQSQIDAQSNLRRGELLTQAASQSRDFANNLVGRGFSSASPFALFNQQSNLMRANSGAASNETGLNFNAAKANSDARLQAAGINAGLQGDYMRSIANQNQLDADYELKNRGMQFDIFKSLLGGLI